jgi:hypothetical protein
LIQAYSGKNITAATAGLAYNLGIAPAGITAVGLHNEDVNNGDDAGAQNYDFTDRGNFVAGPGGLNLAKYTHYKLIGHNPVTDVA